MPFSTKNLNAKFAGSDILDVTGWNVEDGGEIVAFKSSDTNGGVGRIDGWDDITAEVTALQDTTTQVTDATKKGDTGTLALYEDGTLNWSFPVIVLGVTVNVSADSNDPVTYTIRFGWDAKAGALTRPA